MRKLEPLIKISQHNNHYYVWPQKIIRIETEAWKARSKNRVPSNGDGNLTWVYLDSSSGPYLVSKKISDWEKELQAYDFFFKPHQSHLININYMDRIVFEDGWQLIMQDGEWAPLVPKRLIGLQDLLKE